MVILANGWVSSDISMSTIDNTGKLTILSDGKTTITNTKIDENSNKVYSDSIKVYNNYNSDKFYLYNYGNEYTSITGGWVSWSTEGGSIVKEKGDIYIYGANGCTNTVGINNLIDITKYSSLNFVYDSGYIETSSSGARIILGITTNVGYNGASQIYNKYANRSSSALLIYPTESNTILTNQHTKLNISSLSGSVGVGIMAHVTGSGKIYQIWLE
jgi:hypothetical protein